VRPRYLIDTSAFLRLDRQPVAASVLPLIAQGSVALCVPVLLEVMYSAAASSYDRTLAKIRSTLPVIDIDAAAGMRAVDVQQALAAKSQHRAAKPVDMLIAACAETRDLTLLHYDKDYDAIAAVTGQPTMWVVPRGSVS
jgi:predicted nucleic acid-binding protein